MPVALAVVIPARNEAGLIGTCLTSVARSMRHLRRYSDVTVTVTVVADGCEDDTAEIAREHEADVIMTEPVGVGAARHRGTEYALAQLGEPVEAVWLAHTDADSRVHRGWLLNQFRAASGDAHVRIGAVKPDFTDLTDQQVHAWKASHRGGAARGHIHGANLGVRASTYLAVGGFSPLTLHEDVELVHAASRAGVLIAADARADVTTSGRSISRVYGGYATYLSTGLIGLPACS